MSTMTRTTSQRRQQRQRRRITTAPKWLDLPFLLLCLFSHVHAQSTSSTSSSTSTSSTIVLFDDDKLVDETGVGVGGAEVDPSYDDDDDVIQPIHFDDNDDDDDDQDEDDSLQPEYTPLHYRQAIDFRDLFLSPEESFALGGSGLQPYGNTFSEFLWPVIEDMTDPNGSNMISDMVVGYTIDQSGIAGSLRINSTFYFGVDIEGTFMEIEASNIRVDGLETLKVYELLQPTNQPHVLHTSFSVSDLQVALTFQLKLTGPSPVTTMDNTVDIIISVPEANFSFDLMILMDAMSLFMFPIGNLLEIPCWMNLLMDTTQKEHDAVELQNLHVELSKGIALTVNCLDCSTLMQIFLPQLMGTLQDSFSNTTNNNLLPTYTNTITASSDSLVSEAVEQLMEDAVYNAWELMDLQTATHEAKSMCPHHSQYDEEDYDTTAHANATFGIDFETFMNDVVADTVSNINETSILLSQDSFEAIMAAGIVGVETAMVIAGQKYIDANQTQPNIVFVPPPNTTENYLNWTNLPEEAPLLDLALQASGTISTSLANNLIKDNMFNYDNNTAFQIPLNLTVDSNMGHIIEVYQVVVYGLDTITSASLLVPITAYQLRSWITWGNVRVEAHLNITGANEQRHPEETMVMSIEAHDIAVMVDVLIPIDVETLGEVPVGGILQNEFDCLVTVVQNATITNLNVTIGQVDPPTVDGYLDGPLEDLVNDIGQNFIDDYGDDLSAAVPMFFQTTIRNLLNTLLYEQVNIEPNCHVTVPQPPGFMDFQDLLLQDTPYGRIVSDIYTGINTTFFNQDGVNRLNQIIARATADQSNSSGVLDFLTDFDASFSTQIALGNWVAAAGGAVSNISLTNLDSLGMPLRLIWPTEPIVLDSNITLGADNYYTNATQPLTVSADIVIAASDGKEMNIYNEISVSFGIIDLHLWTSILLKIAEAAFLYFPLKAAGNLDCWMLLVPPRRQEDILEENNYLPGISFDLLFEYYNATVGMDCVNCSSPLLPEMIETLYRVGENSSDLIEQLARRFVEGEFLQTTIDNAVRDSQSRCLEAPEILAERPCVERPEGGDNSTTLVDANWTSSNWTTAGNWSNWTEPEWVSEDWTASDGIGELCPPEGADAWKATLPPSDEEGEDRDPNATFFNIGFASFSGAIMICFIAARIVVHHKNKRWMESLPPQGAKFLKHIQDKERERDEYLDDTMASLYQSVFIPGHIRIAVPIIIVVNMGFFVVAHLATSITISVEVNFGGEYFIIHDLFLFNFRDGLVNTFLNGGYEMAILLLIFGGVWPYFRCILSLILWFTPPHVLSSSIRGRMYLWIDAMNKLTVRDIFKFMIIIAIFFVYVGGPYVFNEGTGDLYNVRVLGWPGPAIYCGITAMIISRVSSRWLLAYHYRAVDGAREAYHKDRVGSISKDTDKATLSDDSCDGSGFQKTTSNPKLEQATSNPKLQQSRSNPSITTQEQPEKMVEVSLSDDEDEEHESDGEESDDETEDESDDEDSVEEEILNEGGRTISICGREFLLGNVAVFFAIITVFNLLIVALVFIPAISIDLSAILELFLESGTTYEQAISQFGVYAFICALVLKARLAVESASDYVAVVILLALGVVLISFTWIMDAYRWIHDVLTNGWRRIYPTLLEKDEHKRRERNLVMMPSYLRLKATQYSTVYVIAYALGIYQLGAVTIYAIHYFCRALDTLYGALAFVGLITSTEGECWEAQMKQYHNIIVLIGCFLYLTFMFFEQLVLQRKANVAEARKFLQELQEQRAWEEELANSAKDAEVPIRRLAAAGESAGQIMNGSTVTDSEGWSNFESANGESSSNTNPDHDLDGQYIGDARFSFTDPRYSFNDQFRPSFQVPNDRPSFRASTFQDEEGNDHESDLTTISESDPGDTEEDSSRQNLLADAEDDEEEQEEELLPPPLAVSETKDANGDDSNQHSASTIDVDCDLVEETTTETKEPDHLVEFDV